MRFPNAIWPFLVLAAAIGCGGSKRTIRIPDSVMADPKSSPGQRPPIQPYVIKMSDGHRTWQIEIPASEASGAFSAIVPLNLGDAAGVAPPVGPPTEADREIADAVPAASAAEPATSPATVTQAAAAEDGASKSYLAAVARVSALFRKRQFELALIDLVDLERDHPDDERILEMKGTLFLKLKKPKLAREAWERVLALNPENAVVAQALENLLGD